MTDRDRTPTSCGAVTRFDLDDHAVDLHFDRARMRIEATAADVVRVRFSPRGDFTAHRSFHELGTVAGSTFEVEQDEALLRLRTGHTTIEVDTTSGALEFLADDGRRFARDLAGPSWHAAALADFPALASVPDADLPEGRARTAIVLRKHLGDGEGIFGLGERTGRSNRRHRRVTNWTVDRSSPGHSRGHDNLYQAHPFLLAARAGFAWGLYVDSTWLTRFDAGAASEDELEILALGGEIDTYVFCGPTPAAVVEQLTRLTGRPALPPLWALGYHQSRWSYGSDAEVRAIADGFRERDLPLDAIHLDIDYMDDYRVFTWNAERFPDPAATVAALHARDVRTVVIVDPGVKDDRESGYAVADDGLTHGHFVRDVDGTPFTGHVWPGRSLFPDFCRADTRRWWGDLHADLVRIGIDGVWCDMNEPSIVDRPFRTPGVKEKPIPLAAVQGDEDPPVLHAEAHNLYGALMARATAEGLARLRPDRRPWVLTRSAFVGTQSHAASWMGDNSSWWEHLEMSLPQLAAMGLSGAPHVGVDIGGFYHDCHGELYARWMELGTFYPFMRGHTRQGSRAQEPWAFGPAVEEIAREALRLRYRLLPYLYTLAHRAHRTGEPILRPMLFDFPEQDELFEIDDQIMFGPHLLVAPVIAPGVRRRLVELPDGEWFDFHTGLTVPSGPRIQPAPVGRTPLFVRAGAILTLGEARTSTAEPLRELTVAVYPGADSTWTLIEDDGETPDPREESAAETTFDLRSDDDTVVLDIGARAGGFVPPSRKWTVRVHVPAPPPVVRWDGERTDDWRYDADGRCVELRRSDDGAAHRLEVEVETALG